MELYDEAERERYVAATKAAIDRLGAKWNGQTLAELLALADEPDEIAREMPFAVQQSVLLQALRFASVIQHSHDLAAELRQATRDRRILAAQQQYDCDAYGALLDQLGLVSEGEAGPPRADQVIPVFERFIGEGQAWLDELVPPVEGGPRLTPAEQRERLVERLRQEGRREVVGAIGQAWICPEPIAPVVSVADAVLVVTEWATEAREEAESRVREEGRRNGALWVYGATVPGAEPYPLEMPPPGCSWVRCWKSATGPQQRPGWRWEATDVPISDLVAQLNRSIADEPPLVPTAGSCAGHRPGEVPHVLLDDGRVLVVLPSQDALDEYAAFTLPKGANKGGPSHG